ncbi:MAG: ChaN family lipoprotein [Nitrospiraceae bacterium]|nr:MAG: ChaN family lipoprotein [Nitrospiraceae bacterium]
MNFHNSFSYIPVFLILVLLLLVTSQGHAETTAYPECRIDVSFDINESKINGVSRISLTAGKNVLFRKGPLKILYIRINDLEAAYDQRQEMFEFTPDRDGMIEIGFEGTFADSAPEDRRDGIASNVIDGRGISLTGLWYPALEGLCNYALKAQLPPGYNAVSEAEEIYQLQSDTGAEFNFIFPHPVDGINLIATDRYRVVEDNFAGINIAAYFFKEDLGLARAYLEYSIQYLELYEKLLGKYPYKRFSIVENFLPTGYSMPTYTLLGSSVVRLPFIVETSLGHEILHQWFGNHVYIDYERGNWAEGLTAYLSDHLYKERKGEGWDYRKQIMIDYASYVGPDNDFPLRSFTGRYDRGSRSIGYGKAAMMFHMLRRDFGDQDFFSALQDFIRDNRYRRASWQELRSSFQEYFEGNLHGFFTEWLDRTGMPDLDFEDVEVTQRGIKYELSFNVSQKDIVYALDIPVSIYIGDAVIKKAVRIESENKSYQFVLPDMPDKIVFDEDYDVGRKIKNEEFPPVIGRLLGEKNLLMVLPQYETEIYKAATDKFSGDDVIVKNPGDVKNSDIRTASVAILGENNPVIKRIFGRVPPVEAGFHIAVRKNPWNQEKVVAIINGISAEETNSAFSKIVHYGKYSRLTFNNGKNISKEIEPTDRGIVYELYSEPEALDLSAISRLGNVIESVSDKKIIYVGEMHDVFAHHAVQLDIIAGIHKQNDNIAIGMEMFQRQYQSVLDAYIAGEMEEKEFLKSAEYFKQWGFDYNLYKPILDFARTEGIPVIALNANREIVKKVSAGGIDSLSDEEMKEIPVSMDFSDEEYRERLKEVFEQHEGDEEREFDYFYESQILWDETMSMSISEYLEREPDRQIIVIAGRGHLSFGSGIPNRTYARTGERYAIVLIDAEVVEGIADYIVFPSPVKGAVAPRLMVFVNMEEMGFEITGFPDHSVSEKSGIKKGDILMTLDDNEIKSINDLKVYLQYKNKGDIIRLKVFRPVKQEETDGEEDRDTEETKAGDIGELEGEEMVIDVTL